MENEKLEKARPIINKALQFYANKLTALREDEELRYNNDAIREDLRLEAEKIQHITEDFRNPETGWRAIRMEKKAVCSVLKYYVNHLEYSKRMVSQKLGEDVTPNFATVDNEINLTKAAMEGMCNDPSQLLHSY